MTHDPLCPSSDKRYDYTNTETRATSFGRIGLTRPCQCHLIAKVRRDERNYILNLAADTIKNHKVQHGRCLCLAYVESEEQHRDDIIRRYVASALTRDGQEMGLIP